MGWEKVLRLLVVNRLIEPGSEFRLHRHWFVESAMDRLLEESFEVAGKDRLYRCLDHLLGAKRDGAHPSRKSASAQVARRAASWLES